jgi:poly(3-hydroxybutyrate) depolymerase
VVVLGRETYVYKPLPCAVHRCIDDAPSQIPAAIFVLHGSYETGAAMFDVGFEALADLHGFLVVYPEMEKPRSEEWKYTSDIPYFEALVNHFKGDKYLVRPDKFFVCGHSAGGTMSLFLQNEVDLFAAAGTVEAAVGHLQLWDMSKSGHRTMVVWNHADPVLTYFAPGKIEKAYLDLTINTLRRGSMTAGHQYTEKLPLGENILQAEMLTFAKDQAPELKVLHFTSKIGQHTWPSARWTTGVDAAEQLTAFFLELPRSPLLHLLGPHGRSYIELVSIIGVVGFVIAAVFLVASKSLSSKRLNGNNDAPTEPLLAVTV